MRAQEQKLDFSVVRAILAITVFILLVDGVWLLIIRRNFHLKLFVEIQGGVALHLRIIPAALVYCIMPIGIYFCAVKTSKTLISAAFRGTIAGLLCFGVHNLVNHATLVQYSFEMTWTDTLYGVLLCTFASAIGYFFKMKGSGRQRTQSQYQPPLQTV